MNDRGPACGGASRFPLTVPRAATPPAARSEDKTKQQQKNCQALPLCGSATHSRCEHVQNWQIISITHLPAYSSHGYSDNSSI